MVKKSAVPDAWDDDWETQADKAADQDAPQPAESVSQPLQPKTKAERLAQHSEANRKLWESAYVFALLTGEKRGKRMGEAEPAMERKG